MTTAPTVGIDLFWLPLGAGGHFVRLNGRVYEFFRARRERRKPLDLYHAALQVVVPDGRYVIENSWPIPNSDPDSRGVTIEGPVWATQLGRFRFCRYEVRRWLNGSIADAKYAVSSPRRVSNDIECARSVLALASELPVYVWGRDLLKIGDMWNSNSVIAWLLARAGINASGVHPPAGGRAPGWMTGVLAAELDRTPTSKRS